MTDPSPAARASLARALRAAQQPIAGSRRLTRWYLSLLGRVGRAVDTPRFGARLMNLASATPWPDVELPARAVNLAPGCEVQVHPHVGESDLSALFSSELPYERAVFRVLDGRLDAYDAVVEIGANVGLYTLFFAHRLAGAPHKRVYAFEPSRKAFERLSRNLDLNGVRNVDAFNCAVYSQTGVIDFFEPEGHLTNGSVDAAFAAHFTDRVERRRVLAVGSAYVDGLLQPHARALIKIDVEGAEPEVVAALEPTIRRLRPDLVLEVLEWRNDRLQALSWLQTLYTPMLMTDDGLVEQTGLYPHEVYRDYLLSPRK